MDKPEYTPPLDPELAALVDALDLNALEFFLERAAIREIDGKQTRQAAEAAAWAETRRYRDRRNSLAMDDTGCRKNQK